MIFQNHFLPMKELLLFYCFFFVSDCLHFIIPMFVYFLFVSPVVHSAECQDQYCFLCSFWIVNSPNKLLQNFTFLQLGRYRIVDIEVFWDIK